MIVTIDGPAGVGKSSVARQLARRLEFDFLDTGAMYRAVTWAALREQVDLTDGPALARLAKQLQLRMSDDQVWVDGQNVTREIRSPEVTAQVRFIADQPCVRSELVARQQQIVGERDFVTEGRDQGTVAFPDAECKIYLNALPITRARRRWEQLPLEQRCSVDDVLEQQTERDERDASRDVGKLVAAHDAIELATDELSEAEVVERLVTVVQARQNGPSPRSSESPAE